MLCRTEGRSIRFIYKTRGSGTLLELMGLYAAAVCYKRKDMFYELMFLMFAYSSVDMPGFL